MPKFQVSYDHDLTTTLDAMGFPIGPMPLFCTGCLLSQVRQATHLVVDDKGTTAGAATGAGVTLAARRAMVVDHPFVFAIVDDATDAPLFVGAIGSLG